MVLPLPDSPMMATYSPCSTVKLTLRSASTLLPPSREVYTFRSPLTSKILISMTSFVLQGHYSPPFSPIPSVWLTKGEQRCHNSAFHSATNSPRSSVTRTVVPFPTVDSMRMPCRRFPHIRLHRYSPIPLDRLSSRPFCPV